MTSKTNCQHTEQTCKETKKCLDAIEALIKARPYRSIAREKLDEMSQKDLCPNHHVDLMYLNGRYYFYEFQEGNDIENLEWANDYLDDMVRDAYSKNVKVDDQRYHYSRAYVKFRLSQLVWDQERIPWLRKKSKDITDRSLSIDPDNSSFNWLRSQLEA